MKIYCDVFANFSSLLLQKQQILFVTGSAFFIKCQNDFKSLPSCKWRIGHWLVCCYFLVSLIVGCMVLASFVTWFESIELQCWWGFTSCINLKKRQMVSKLIVSSSTIDKIFKFTLFTKIDTKSTFFYKNRYKINIFSNISYLYL